MRVRFCNFLWKITSSGSGLGLTCGCVFIIGLSGVFSVFIKSVNIPETEVHLDSGVFLSAHVHKLLTYCFSHSNPEQLVVDAAVLLFFCTGLEKAVGTVRFLQLFILLVPFIGVLHVLVELLMFPASGRRPVSGLVPVSLAMLGIMTFSSRIKKVFVLGFTLPTAALPWFLMLWVSLVIPQTGLLCNISAVGAGRLYTMWFPVLQMSESRACAVEKTVFFRWLRKITPVSFIPASAGQRTKILHTVCSPSPGSYPVQAYALASSSSSSSSSQATGNTLSSVDGWSYSSVTQQKFTPPLLEPGCRVEPGYQCSSNDDKYQCNHYCLLNEGDVETASHVHFHSRPSNTATPHVQSPSTKSNAAAEPVSTVASVPVLFIH